MNSREATAVADQLNQVGVFVFVEVNGIQHQFRLSLKELAPTSPVFAKNERNIADTVYMLIPIPEANAIRRIGRDLFKNLDRFQVFKRTEEADYLLTPWGKFVRLESLSRLDQEADRLTREMRQRAEEMLLGKYDGLYRSAFLRAFSFFSKDKEEFRDLLARFNGEMSLFWIEVDRIYKELQVIENDGRTITGRRKIKLKDLVTPDLKAGYKLWQVPKTLDEYCDSIDFTIGHLGFHPIQLERYEFREYMLHLKTLRDVQAVFKF